MSQSQIGALSSSLYTTLFCAKHRIFHLKQKKITFRTAFFSSKIWRIKKKSLPLQSQFGNNRWATLYRGVEQLVARQAHNLEVVRSSRASATTKHQSYRLVLFFVYFQKQSAENRHKSPIILVFIANFAYPTHGINTMWQSQHWFAPQSFVR